MDTAPDRPPPAQLRVYIRSVSDAEISRTAPAELRDLPLHFWAKASPVMPDVKTPISLRVDSDVLAWFRSDGPRYQSWMNAVLRSFMEHAAKVGKKRRQRRR